MLWSRNFPLVWEIPAVKDVLYCVFVEKHPDLIKIQDPMKPQFACAAQRHVVVADIALRGAGWVPEERGHHWPAAAHTLPKRASLSFWGTAALLLLREVGGLTRAGVEAACRFSPSQAASGNQDGVSWYVVAVGLC